MMVTNSHLINTLFKQFPYKCDDLEYILDNTNNIKDLSATFELIVNSIFGLDTGINLTQNERNMLQWPLKLINKYTYQIEYNSIYKFLSTGSLFWSIIFKLSNLEINFKYSINLMPTYIKYRIESGLSPLATRLDSMNYLNLNALEYYLISFLTNILTNDTLKQQNIRSNYFYNEYNGKMDLNCIYSDLLDNYMNFFLPINTRDVHFPQLLNSTQLSQRSSSSVASSPIFLEHPNKVPRLLKPYYLINEQYGTGETNDNLSHDGVNLLEQINMNLFQKKLDRTSDLQKIDFFIKMLIDLWLCPFSDENNEKYLNVQLIAQIDVIFLIKLFIKHIYSFSNANFNQNEKNKIISSQTTSAAGGASSTTTYHMDKNNNSDDNINLNDSLNFDKQRDYQTPIDNLRIKIVDTYLRKPIYKFFKYNIENWPLSPTIKFMIETWLMYIQPWCPPQAQEEMQYEQFMSNIHPSTSIWCEFIRDNLFNYVDILQLIFKRYYLLDLTVLSNVHLLYRICCVFSQQYLIQTLQKTENLIFYIQRAKISVQSLQRQYNQQHSTASSSSLLINNKKINIDKQSQQKLLISIMNLFKEFNKPIYEYRSVFCRKLIGKLLDSLVNTRNIILNDTDKNTTNITARKKDNFFVRSLKAMFTDTSEQKYVLAHLSANESEQLLQLIEECAQFLNQFSQQTSDESHIEDTKMASGGLSKLQLSLSDEKKTPECEVSDNGLTLRLSPRGRYQMINAICRTNLEKIYDPDTAPVNEFELKFLLNVFKCLTSLVNEKYQNAFKSLYERNNIIGKIARRILYGPLDYKNKMTMQGPNIDIASAKTDETRKKEQQQQQQLVRLSLRKLADYRFLLYSIFTFYLIKFVFGFTYLSNFAFIGFIFACYILISALMY